MAMDSRLIRTSPWPMVWAARFAPPAAEGTDPEKTGTGSCDQSEPMPNSLTTWVHWLAVSRSDSSAKAVPQPSAKAVLNGFGWPVPALVKVCPSTVKEPAHEIGVDADTPYLTSAAADTMVNALPGVSLRVQRAGRGQGPGRLMLRDRQQLAGRRPDGDNLARAGRALQGGQGGVLRRRVDRGTHRRARRARPLGQDAGLRPAEFTATTSVVGVPSS